MKNMVIIISCIIVFTFNAHSELIESDLNKIRLIVKEEVKTAIHDSEKRMKQYVDSQITHLDKSINRNFQLILALIGFVTIVVGIPQIIVVFQNKRHKSISEDIEAIKELVAK